MAVRLEGKIVDIRVDRQDVVFRLDNNPAEGPKDNSFILRGDHGNASEVFSLALAAAANRWPVTIRIGGDGQIDQAVEATIRHISVGWAMDDSDND